MSKTIMLAAAIAGLSLGVPPAFAQKADVMHWWTSGGESRAVKVFADAYNKAGGTWVDDPAIGPQAEHAAALNRIAGGDPPTGLMWNAGVAVQQLAQQGVLRSLDDLAKQDNLVANLPPLLAKSITYDGHVIAIPVDIGGGNYMYYSLKVFHDLNMEPPKTWDEFLTMAPKIKAAGIIPLAFGGNAQQEDWLFSTLVAGVGSADLYRKVFVDHDPKAAASPEMEHVFSVMGQLRQYVDAGSPNRKWNDTLALVETNKAAMMIVGDWASADFTAAHLVFDKDYSCQMAPGNQNAYVMTEDVFVFPKTNKPEQIQAGDKLAKVMMDPAVQTAFNRIKGSLPARQDASTEGLDPCAQIGAKIIAGGPANQLPNFALAFSPDTEGQIEDLLGSYWATPSMTAAEAAKRLSTILAGAS